ncbi:30S ribosomal protein S6 [Chloroflexota bacterium]
MVSEKTIETEDNQRVCELILVISPRVEEDGLNSIIDNVNQLITEKGGTSSEVEHWGKRKLAYPIKHFLEGHYVLIRYKSVPTLNKALESSLGISEEVIRFLLTRPGN